MATETFEIDVERGYTTSTMPITGGTPGKLYLAEDTVSVESTPPNYSGASFYYYETTTASPALYVGPRPKPKHV